MTSERRAQLLQMKAELVRIVARALPIVIEQVEAIDSILGRPPARPVPESSAQKPDDSNPR